MEITDKYELYALRQYILYGYDITPFKVDPDVAYAWYYGRDIKQDIATTNDEEINDEEINDTLLNNIFAKCFPCMSK